MSGTDAEPLAERLDRLESREAIADLIHGYAHAMCANRAEDTRSLFAPNSFFEIRDGHPDRPEFEVRERTEGREAIVAHLSQVKGGPHPLPLIHNLLVDVRGDSATADCLMEARFYGADMRVTGDYHDTFQRIDGRWFFTSRTYTIYAAASSV